MCTRFQRVWRANRSGFFIFFLLLFILNFDFFFFYVLCKSKRSINIANENENGYGQAYFFQRFVRVIHIDKKTYRLYVLYFRIVSYNIFVFSVTDSVNLCVIISSVTVPYYYFFKHCVFDTPITFCALSEVLRTFFF